MDTEKVLATIDEFIGLIERHRKAVGDPRDQLEDVIKTKLPVMERIADVVDPGRPRQWRSIGPYTATSYAPGRDIAIRLRSLVASQAEVDAMLGPAGPQLSASGLHPGVWGAAAELWDDGHLRAAVQAAATFVDLRLQAKLDRHNISGADLATQAFKLDPIKPGERRLRFPDLIEGSEAYKSAHAGAMHFGAGVMLAIRNPATHDLTQPGEQVALEYLAALSILARWVDEAEDVGR